jgi:hypothetical protein
MKVFNALKTRGVEEMLIAVTDGLKGRYRPAHKNLTASSARMNGHDPYVH